MRNGFLEQERCDRCYSDLKARTTSWFNEDTICLDCSNKEDKIVEARSESKTELEGIGYIPEVDIEISWKA